MRATIVLVFFALFAPWSAALAADQDQGKARAQPPANVVTAEVRSGSVTPQAVFVGTIHFPEVSEVAAEVEGRVEAVDFDDGDRVARGRVLARLDTAIMETQLAAQEAGLAKAQASLEKARLDLSRLERLFAQKTVSEQEYDNARFTEREQAGQAESAAREADRLRIRLAKAHVRAPFGGVILERAVERGEWLSPGSVVATLARDDQVEIMVYVPASVFRSARPGLVVAVDAAGQTLAGRVAAAVPSGDQATRTFPVKVLAANNGALAQGMEARVSLPLDGTVEALIVPRDALVLQEGQNLVYAVAEGKAVPIHVEVAAWQDLDVAVIAQGLTPGMSVIVKGQERLRPGQSVHLVQP